MDKILLLATWYNLADGAVSHAVARGLVFLQFGKSSLQGNKPDTAMCVHLRKVVVHNLCKALLDSSIPLNTKA